MPDLGLRSHNLSARDDHHGYQHQRQRASSLRQALADANDGDTIDATGISGVIILTSGQLLVDKSVTINGAGADMLAIDGNMASRVFQIGVGQAGESVTISGLTIRNAQGSFGGGIFITNAATATIVNCTVSGSSAGSAVVSSMMQRC